MTTQTLTAATTPSDAVALTAEQTAALALLAAPGDDRPTPGYVLQQHDAKNVHRSLVKVLTAAGRPDLVQSQPAREVGSIAADKGRFMLHPADEHAISQVAWAFGANDITMTLFTARFLHDSLAKHRARQTAVAHA